MSFETTALSIIKDSINNALCIDDQFLEPYEETKSDSDGLVMPKEMYTAFREANCNIDFFRYKGEADYDKALKHIPGKDLLILDWELENNEDIKYKKSLDILKHVVTETSVPFICIYTHTPVLKDVGLGVRVFFSGYCRSVIDTVYNEVEAIVNDLEENDFFELFDELPILNDFINEAFTGKNQDTYDKIESKLSNESGLDDIKEMIAKSNNLKDCLGDSNELFHKTLLCLALREKYLQIEYEREVGIKEIGSEEERCLSYKINDKLLLIMHKDKDDNERKIKGGFSPSKLVSEIAKRIYLKPNTFLNLLWLEMRNKTVEMSSDVGSFFKSIDEKAFFYHRKQCEENNNIDYFNDFLKKLWTDDVALRLASFDSDVINKLENYPDKNEHYEAADKAIKELKKNKLTKVLEQQLEEQVVELTKIVKSMNKDDNFGNTFIKAIREHKNTCKLYKKELNKLKNKQSELVIKAGSDLKDTEDFLTELAKVNHYFSIISSDIRGKMDARVMFGDILFNEESSTYYICITPHCDCARPERNLKNNFYFLKGERKEVSAAINKPESYYYSFIMYNDEVFSIEWDCQRIHTLHIDTDNNSIEDNEINVVSTSEFKPKEKEKEKEKESTNLNLIYCGTQKENYTQRLANEAFRWTNRVGINFLQLDI